MNDDAEGLVDGLKQAFDRSKPPSRPAEIVRGSEAWEETDKFWNKTWDALCLNDFDSNRYCLNFFPSDAIAYFLGALMYKMAVNAVGENSALDMMLSLWLNEDSPLGSADGTNVRKTFVTKVTNALDTKQVHWLEKFFEWRSVEFELDDAELAAAFLRDIRKAT